MKRVSSLIFSFCLILTNLCSECYVTYDFSGGRFGDNVLAYLHAKWLSYKYGIPMLCRPFGYASDLIFYEKEFLYDEEFAEGNKQIVLGFTTEEPSFSRGTIFYCPYFSEIPWEFSVNKHWFSFQVDWKDKEFKKLARELIAPNKPCKLTLPPEDQVSIALHIRDGGTHDDYELRFKHPLKVPPLSFYIESLQEIIELFPGKSLYCYCFTDALDPEKLVQEIRKGLSEDATIVFEYRTEENHDKKNVLEDFFSLFHFDVLVRAASNYSIIPALIGDYALVLYPENFYRQGTYVKITEIGIDRDEERFQLCLNKG